MVKQVDWTRTQLYYNQLSARKSHYVKIIKINDLLITKMNYAAFFFQKGKLSINHMYHKQTDSWLYLQELSVLYFEIVPVSVYDIKVYIKQINLKACQLELLAF